MPPAFLYFDLGNVLLYFSHEQGCRQIAEVAGISPEQVRSVLFSSGLQDRCERGELNGHELYRVFCEHSGTQGEFDRLEQAGNEIFTCNQSMIPLLGHLHVARHRMGILSNIGQSHWNYVSSGRYGIITEPFEIQVLSFEVGAIKPDRKIFEHAAEKAGVAPSEIFYTDDRAENVGAAREFGFDAVQYTSTMALARELHKRGVRSNF